MITGYRRILNRTALVAVLFVLLALGPLSAAGRFEYPDIGDFEVFSMAGKETKLARKKTLLEPGSRHAIAADGLTGLFIAETADRLPEKHLYTGFHYSYHQLTARGTTAYHSSETGHVSSWNMSAVYLGDWGEWSVKVPLHDYSLAAPRTYGRPAVEEMGMGDLKLGFKATYLPDKSYYRWAYGAVVTTSTGNGEKMRPAGPKYEDELKLFGVVTTKETDNAVANFEFGGLFNANGKGSRFLYRAGFSYQANAHVNWIGELAGEVEGGDDRDNLDLVFGMRLSPSKTMVFELAYVKNLRTYREYGYDEQYRAGTTIRW
jgi:hypothetical protein